MLSIKLCEAKEIGNKNEHTIMWCERNWQYK